MILEGKDKDTKSMYVFSVNVCVADDIMSELMFTFSHVEK